VDGIIEPRDRDKQTASHACYAARGQSVIVPKLENSAEMEVTTLLAGFCFQRERERERVIHSRKPSTTAADGTQSKLGSSGLYCTVYFCAAGSNKIFVEAWLE
jgi:hypothetical protein